MWAATSAPRSSTGWTRSAPGDKVVMELSSFQLELFDRSPSIAALLNITPNHLDRHPSMSHYAAAKANILRFQKRGRYVRAECR